MGLAEAVVLWNLVEDAESQDAKPGTTLRCRARLCLDNLRATRVQRPSIWGLAGVRRGCRRLSQMRLYRAEMDW